ncbi:MAG: hypothetical protein GY767_22255 [Shimia sp.]|nr:hypothetical protein [Shimia sp.]
MTTVNLANVETQGVYVIWLTGDPSRAVCVGQGDVKERLSVHRDDPAILNYQSEGSLLVTWAAVPAHQRDGVERYLADQYSPLVGDAFPDAAPIQVNLVA